MKPSKTSKKKVFRGSIRRLSNRFSKSDGKFDKEESLPMYETLKKKKIISLQIDQVISSLASRKKSDSRADRQSVGSVCSLARQFFRCQRSR